MARPFKCRRVRCQPGASYFKPVGIPLEDLEEVLLGIDELEALRLADGQGLYQEEAAGKMNVSRQTFGNIIESARKKIAEAVVNGKALKIEGGVVQNPQGQNRTLQRSCNNKNRERDGRGAGRSGMRCRRRKCEKF